MIWRLTLLVSFVMAVLVILVLSLLLTQSGTRALVGSLDSATELELEYGGGSLLGALLLRRIVVPTDEAIVTLQDTYLRLHPGCLWRGEVCLQELHIGDLEVEVPLAVNDEQDELEQNPFWPLPVAVSAADLTVAELFVHWAGGELRSEAIVAVARVEGDKVHLASFLASATRLSVPDSGRDTENGSSSLLPTIDLPLELVVDSMILHDSRWAVSDIRNDYDELRLHGQWTGTELEVASASVSNAVWGELSLVGSMTFEHPYPVAASSSFGASSPPLWSGLHGASGDLSLEGSLAQLTIRASLCAKLPATVEATVDLLSASLPMSLQARGGCEEIVPAVALGDLPGLEQGPDIEIAGDWTMQANGNMARQTLALQATASGYELERVNLDLQAVHSPDLLHVSRLLATLDDGDQAAEIVGDVSYSEGLAWDLELGLSEVELPPQLAPLTGVLSGSLLATGGATGEAWAVELMQIAMQGMLNEYPAEIAGQFRLDQDLSFDGSDLEVFSNGTRLRLLDPVSEPARVDVVVEDIGHWLEGARGGGKGVIHWNRAGSTLDVDAVATELQWGLLQIAGMEISGRYAYDPGGETDLRLRAESLLLGDRQLDNVSLALAGTPENHRLEMQTGGDLSTTLDVRGSLQASGWQGEVQPTRLVSNISSWQLAKSIQVAYWKDTGLLTLADHCWTEQNATACVSSSGLGRSGDIKLNLQGSLVSLVDLLPGRYTGRGTLEARLSARWEQMEIRELNGALELGAGRLEEELLGGGRAEVDWDAVSIGYRGDRKSGRLRGLLRREDTDQIVLDMTMPTALDGELAGSLSLDDLGLMELRPFVHELNRLQGDVSGSLQFSGKVRAPRIHGSLSLSDGALALAGNPTRFERAQLEARFAGERADLVGEFHVGPGSSQVRGELSWLDEPRLLLTVRGEEKAFLYPAETVVYVEEDIQLEITAQHIRLSGEVDIPHGEIV